MTKEYKSTKIRLAFEEFANAHKGEELKTRDINAGVKIILGSSLSGWCVSDFATPETSRKESHLNKPLFKRLKRGLYLVVGTENNN